jgi:aspartyl-tRNA(Asn)/glutamyl-tRNA(Gln) amidotransferase subunit A
MVEPEVAALVASAAAVFADLGAEVAAVDPPGGDPTDIFRTLWWAGAHAVTRHLGVADRDRIDPGLRRIAEEGAEITLDAYQEATRARGAYGSGFRQFMAGYDFLLTPSVAVAAFDAGQLSPLGDDGNAWLGWTPFSYPFNLTQQPAASVNCGFTAAGLPVGLQIVGRMFDDAGVLAAARAFEDAVPLHRRTPPGF